MLVKYKYIGEAEAIAPTIHQQLQPGDEFESNQELNNPAFVLVEEPLKKKRPERSET